MEGSYDTDRLITPACSGRVRVVLCLLLVLAGAALLARPASARDGSFDSYELSLSHPVRQAIFALRKSAAGAQSLLVAGVDESGQAKLSVFALGADGTFPSEPSYVVSLPADVIALDSDGGTLYALTPSGVSRWDSRKRSFSSVVEASSIFQLRPTARLVSVSFLQDVDGDGDSDIVLPGFSNYRLFLQQEDGRFLRGDTLEVPAISHHQEYNRRITYRPVPLYFLDADGNGTSDAVAVRGGSILFFTGRGSGQFKAGRLVPMDLGVTDRFLGDEVGDVDHTDQTWKRIVRVDDFDRNGSADLFTHTVESEGLFDKTHRLELHPGSENAAFAYTSRLDEQIETSVIIDTPSFADLNGDGRLDFGVWSIDLGVGTIFGWLLTGTVDLEVSYYALRPDGSYPAKPDRREVVEASFDLSSGKPAVPPWFVADVNGDQQLDLVLGQGDAELRVFLGDGSEKLFASEPVRTSVTLPGNGRDLVSPLDVNGDGRQDLVIRYGQVDAEGLDRTLTILLAK